MPEDVCLSLRFVLSLPAALFNVNRGKWLQCLRDVMQMSVSETVQRNRERQNKETSLTEMCHYHNSKNIHIHCVKHIRTAVDGWFLL